MPDARPQKKVCTLPPVRVGEDLFNDLMRVAAEQDRKPSDVIRRAVAVYVYAHGPVNLGAEPRQDNV